MHKALMTNLEQARAIFNPEPKKIGMQQHPVTGMCQQMRCVEVHHLGTINRPTFTGEDYLWGTQSAGSLMGVWNFHRHGYDRLYGYFHGPPGQGGTSEDYSEILREDDMRI